MAKYQPFYNTPTPTPVSSDRTISSKRSNSAVSSPRTVKTSTQKGKVKLSTAEVKRYGVPNGRDRVFHIDDISRVFKIKTSYVLAELTPMESLTLAVYNEAANCSDPELLLVALTIINRFESGLFGDTVQQVLTDREQFSRFNAWQGVLYLSETDKKQLVRSYMAVRDAIAMRVNGQFKLGAPYFYSRAHDFKYKKSSSMVNGKRIEYEYITYCRPLVNKYWAVNRLVFFKGRNLVFISGKPDFRS